MKKLAVLNPFAALLILSVALMLFSGAAPVQADVVTITDFSTWSDGGPNTGLFSRPSGAGASFNDATGGQIDTLSAPHPAAGAFFRAMQYDNFQASNNHTPPWSGSSVSYGLTDGNTAIFVSEVWYDSGPFFQAVVKDLSTGQKALLAPIQYTTVHSGWLGIGYNGITGASGEASFWYNDGTAWTEIATYSPNFGGAPTVMISGNDGGQSLRFQVNQIQIFNGSESPVPLPPAVFLLGSGLLGLAGWRRFRKG